MYQIAGLTLAIEGAGTYLKERMKEYMLPLAKEGEHCFDYRVNVQRFPELPRMSGKPIVHRGLWKIADDIPQTIYRELLELDETNIILSFSGNTANVQLLYPDEIPNDTRDFACVGYAMECFCLQKKRMVVHSSCIEVNGKAILFSAPSGTGKSTHTSLWKQYVPNTLYINDDTPILRMDKPEAVYACGSPWSGSTTLNQNRQTPLAAVVLLRRGEKNQMTRIHGTEAYARVLGETRKLPFREVMNQAADMAEELMERVPIYDLSCNISEEAVKVVREELGL